jgi:hypothetical protein
MINSHISIMEKICTYHSSIRVNDEDDLTHTNVTSSHDARIFTQDSVQACLVHLVKFYVVNVVSATGSDFGVDRLLEVILDLICHVEGKVHVGSLFEFPFSHETILVMLGPGNPADVVVVVVLTSSLRFFFADDTHTVVVDEDRSGTYSFVSLSRVEATDAQWITYLHVIRSKKWLPSSC